MRLPIFSRTISIMSAAIAIATGVIVTLGYFLEAGNLGNLRQIFVEWAILLAAMALLVGVLNLLLVHLRKISAGGMNAVYSLVLVIGLIVTFGLGIVLGTDHPLSLWIFNNIQVPVESSLMALLAVTLAYASTRLLSRRGDVFAIIFVVTALVVLFGTVTFPWGEIPLIGDVITPFLKEVLAVAGARGILLGVALGTIATGLRILIGVDRPYGG